MVLILLLVVIGLLALLVFRAFIVPILVIGLAVFVYQKLVPTEPQTHIPTVQFATSNATLLTSDPIRPQMPKSELDICKILEKADTDVKQLADRFEADEKSNDGNEVRKTILLNKDRKPINELFYARSYDIAKTLPTSLALDSWSVKVTRIYFGLIGSKDGKNIIQISGDVPCLLQTHIEFDGLTETQTLDDRMTKVSVGDLIHVSGFLTKHDEQAQGPINSIIWGMPLWGPFGGLWDGTFHSPSFRATITKITDPTPQGTPG